tara:strand:- start:39197 stop:39559 length:363 start_codon:yes stop_codon:yes gene_type:complete
MEPAFFQTWVPIALGVINLGGWGWAILQSPSKENAKAISKLADAMTDLHTNMSTQITALEKRTSTLEDAYKHLPDKESIHRLELNMVQVSGAMNTMGESLKAVREIAIMTRDMIATRESA